MKSLQTGAASFLPGMVAGRKSVAFIEGLMSDEGSLAAGAFLITTGGNTQESHAGAQSLGKPARLDATEKLLPGEYKQGESSVSPGPAQDSFACRRGSGHGGRLERVRLHFCRRQGLRSCSQFLRRATGSLGRS
jgi:hypothetical protein